MGWDFRSRRCLSVLFVALSVSLIATALYQESNFHAFDRIAYLASKFFSSGEVPLLTSCLSRNESSSYIRPSAHQMSPYLLSKLRSYEDLHRRCGPHTGPYNHTIRYLLESGYSATTDHNDSGPTTQCRYVTWTPLAGLGNRMMTLASTFLYALLTDRVLLVDFEFDMGELFCEPFINTSWIMPKNFPYKDDRFHHLQNLQTLMKQQGNSFPVPSFLLVDLRNNVGVDIDLFHCDESQDTVLGKVPVVVIKSDLYFTPLLFMTSSFLPELEKMFPQKETVFHQLGRYLFHPSDAAWKQIVKYYRAYNFDKADVKVGLQIRVVDHNDVPEQVVMNQILNCTQGHNVLPYLSADHHHARAALSLKNKNQNQNQTLKVVLVTSLFRYYGDQLKSMYRASPNSAGEVIEFHQASSDGYQKMDNRGQNLKAWVEMYLLSLCDVLVTTGESTFGYVAQSLGGVKPWVLRKQDKDTSKYPACHRAVTIDACLHYRPRYDCRSKTYIDRVTENFPYIKNCEDRPWWGVRLSDGS